MAGSSASAFRLPRSRINWKRHSSRRSPKKNRCTAYAPDKWSIRQVLNHVTDTERAFAFRALSFARGLESPLPSYDQNVAASGAEADRVSWAAHVEEFQRVRLSTISLFRNMPSSASARNGIASDNRFTVRALAYIIPGHFAHHVSVLREKYL